MKKVLGLLLFLIPFWLQAEIYTLRVDGPIDTLLEEYVVNSFQKIQKAGNARLIIIEMDTPGGYDTSMRAIIKAMMNSKIPCAVFVSPQGARAASAGFFILLAADIAAMAPGTNTGAAHPVSVTGSDIEKTMKEKVTNDAVAYIKTLAKNRQRNQEMAEKAVRESQSYTAEECLKNQLIDLVVHSRSELIGHFNGKSIILHDGHAITLNLQNQKIIHLTMSDRQKFLRTITNPSLAYFLLIFGLIGLYIEFTHPGVIIPGILGGISLLLAFLAFQILPINYVGLFLILLSIGFFIAEIKVQGFRHAGHRRHFVFYPGLHDADQFTHSGNEASHVHYPDFRRLFRFHFPVSDHESFPSHEKAKGNGPGRTYRRMRSGQNGHRQSLGQGVRAR